jgi:RNA-binding protein YlmH
VRGATDEHAQKATVIIQQEIIDIVFEELKRIGQCSSRSQFSHEWLGRNESYYRSIQSKGLKPSVEAQVNLVAKLRDLGMSFSRSEYPTLVEFGHTYLRLYGECLDTLLAGAQSDEVN